MRKNLKDFIYSTLERWKDIRGKKCEFVMTYAVTSNHFLIISILII